MGTECYSMVRGSSIRVTHLDKRGRVTDPILFATSKCVTAVRINEVTDAGINEVLENPEEEKRLTFIRSAQTIRHRIDINFLRVDPGVLSIVAGVPLVYGHGSGEPLGFGEFGFGEEPFGDGGGGWIEGSGFDTLPFGDGPFGGGSEDPEIGDGNVIGFDAGSRVPLTGFALEVWSKLAGRQCEDGSPMYGYTLFANLRGGRLSGFQFRNGLVSFNLIGAQTRRLPGWGVGPHDVNGPFNRMITPVSRNHSYRQFITEGAPPAQIDGVQTKTDVVDNGTAANPMPIPSAPEVLDGGGADTSPYIISGGRA